MKWGDVELRKPNTRPAAERYIDCSPSPEALILSLRDIGYSIRDAIADILDNSITAGATKIWIDCQWNGGKPWLAITDNGCGMDFDTLVNAMRFGSTSPLSPRKSTDLGRFGLGLKTASLSQCKHLIVVSKYENNISACEWDLAALTRTKSSGWLLGVLADSDIKEHPMLARIIKSRLGEIQSGTVVYWCEMDRNDDADSSSAQEETFNRSMVSARSHVEQVFHRFLTPEVGKRRTSILFNNAPLESFDPFNVRHPATQVLLEHPIVLEGHRINVQAYILPHHSKLSAEEYQRYGGEEGYLHNQGFYIYRGRRLIIKGTWFNLLKKEELYKLIRVQVDIPNSLDHLWSLDVKKSHASPPERIKKEIGKIIATIGIKGKKVYKQKGARIKETVKVPAWIREHREGRTVYSVNRSHPFYTTLEYQSDKNSALVFKNFVSVLESTFPVDQFYSDIAETPELVSKPTYSSELLERALDFFLDYLEPKNASIEDFAQELLGVEPFASNKLQTEELLKKRGMR